MQTHDSFTLVRFLHPDGWITYRVLNADGTEPEGSIPDYLTNEVKAKPLSFIGDPQYRLSGLLSLSVVRSNLTRLQGFDPLMLEAVLVFLETTHPTAATMFAKMLAGQETPTPASSLTDVEFASEYRELLLSLPLVVELFSGEGRLNVIQRALGGALLRDAQKSLDHMGHPHFRAVLLSTWIMQQVRSPGERTVVDYHRNVESIAYIADHLEQVMSVRRQLGERHTIDREVVSGLLAVTTPAINEGWL